MVKGSGGVPDLTNEGIDINGTNVIYGTTITAILSFIIVAAVVYFIVVVPMTRMAGRTGTGADADTPAPSDEAVLLPEIRDLLKTQPRA